MTAPRTTLRHALTDPNLLGATLAGPTWSAWRALLLASRGEPLEPDEIATFRQLTGRETAPLGPVEEFWTVAGRRGGKSRAAATLAAYVATLVDHRASLAAGERGHVLLIAPDQRQARGLLDYATAALEASPVLRPLIRNQTSEALSLAGNIDITVRAASFRRLRGLTCVAVLADEAAFWHSDNSAEPDTEILNAVRPTLATTGGPLVVISSPHARRGEVWNTYRRHYGPSGDPGILVAQAPSRTLNPALSGRVVARAMERDPAAASAEYGAQFRSDLEAFVSGEVVERCTMPGVIERPPASGTRYFGFVDPSGGSRDSFTLAIGHREGDQVIIDAVRERRPPFSPDDVVREFADLLRSYRVATVSGDRYAGEWPAERFRKVGVTYRADAAPKSDLYRDLLPRLNAGTVLLPDNPRLAAQLASLERRTSRGGRDTIDHPPNGHDDLANAVAGAAAAAGGRARGRSMVDYL